MNRIKDRFELNNHVVVITGGAGLLGAKHAEAVAEFGGMPILLDIDKEVGQQVSDRIAEEFNVNSLFFHCNITDESSLIQVRDALLDKFGRIDALINNAAIDPKVDKNSTKNLSRLENFMLDQWNRELAVGLSGAMLCSKVFGYEMAKKRKGVILNVSSDLGIIAPDQRLYRDENLDEDKQSVKPVTYSVIKHGLIGLTKYLATYWAKDGVRANTLCPAGVFNEHPDEFVERISGLIPFGRMAEVNEYKASVVFLISEASSYMTGSMLVIDGGRSII